MGAPDGTHFLRRQARETGVEGRGSGDRSWLDPGFDGEAFPRFLAHLRGPAGSREPRYPKQPGRDRPELPAQQRGRSQPPLDEASKLDAAAGEVRGTWA